MIAFAYYTNYLTVVLTLAIAFVLFRRRLHRELPWFTIYIVYVSAYTLSSNLLMLTKDPFTVSYWYYFGNVINQVFAFTVILEVFRNCVRGHDSVRRIGVTVLVILAAIALVFILSTLTYGSEYDKSTGFRVFIRVMQVLFRSIRIVQIALLIGIFALSSYLGLSWRNYNFGIALGYGLYATVNLVAVVVEGYLGPRKGGKVFSLVELIDATAYKLTLILWMTYLWRADRDQSNQPPPSGGDKDLEAWNDALKPLAK